MAVVLDAIKTERGQDVAVVLDITPRMLERIREDDGHVRPWLMRELVVRWRVNPLYVYGGQKEMFLD